jgi:hypothetical protein
MARCQKQRFDLVATEDDRQCLGLFGIGDIVDHPRSAQSGFVQKTQGTHGLNKDALGDLLMEEIELIGTDVLGAEAIGRGVEVLGELGNITYIGHRGLLGGQ